MRNANRKNGLAFYSTPWEHKKCVNPATKSGKVVPLCDKYYFSKEIVGVPLFCFQSKYEFVSVAIEFKMPKHNFKDKVKTFYNIGGEIDWIESALKGKVHNGVMALWKYVKKDGFLEKQQSRSNNSSRFSHNLILWLVINIWSCLKMITNIDL